MNKRVNDEKFEKVQYSVFRTYDNAVIKPGRNLNLIIGPNGTGKSTIVCAIVLGLGGKPKVIGRALQVGEYVKSGRLKAKIEIELNNPGKKNYVVTRVFTTDGHTSWLVNGRGSSLKEVEDLTKSLNIQVDNLCQFLPQDKVQDFSKMNHQQLLENTEKSVGDPVLLEYHLKLKDLRKKHVALQKQITNKSNLLEKQTQKYERLKEIVGGIKKKTAIKKKILTLKQKKAWLLYGESREELVNAKKVYHAAMKKPNQLLETMRPIKHVIAKIKAEAAAAERSMNKHITQTSLKARDLSAKVEDLTSHEEKIQELERSLARKIKAEETRDQEIATAQQQKSKLENDLERITKEFGNEESLAEKQRQISLLIEQHRRLIDQVANQLQKFRLKEDRIKQEIRAQEAELQSVKDVEKQRLMLLRQQSGDAYKGVIWLRENMDKFSTTIHEPMMLKINVKSAQYSKYFENTIAYRDLCAFVCEDKQDMNLLMTNLRDQQRLQVNCVHSDPNKNLNSNPKIPIESISRFGFEYYLSSLVNAPKTILNYLISTYRINNIPIGNDQVENNIERIPNTITSFCSRNNSYSVSTSKYSGEKSTRMSRVTGSGSLSVILDATKLATIQTRLATLDEKKKAVAQNVVKVQKQHTEAEEKMKILRAERSECLQHIEQIKTVRTRIMMVTKEINDLQTQRTSIKDIKETNKREINDIISMQMRAYGKFNKALEEYIEASHKTASVKLEMKLLHRTLVVKQNDCREMKDRYARAKRTVRNFDNDLQSLRAEAHRMLKEAMQTTNGLSPQDESFEKLHNAFSKLPSTVGEINEELKVAQAKVFCLGNDPDGENILRDYERVKIDVENLKHDIQAKETELLNDIQAKETELLTAIQEMEDIRGKWMPPLEQLVNNINENFSSYFASMNCAGEVAITHGENIERESSSNLDRDPDDVNDNEDNEYSEGADRNDYSHDSREHTVEDIDIDADIVEESDFNNSHIEELGRKKATNRKIGKQGNGNRGHKFDAEPVLIGYLLGDERNAMAQSSQQRDGESNAIDMFFASIASTVKNFPPYYQNIAKSKIFNIITDIEMEQIIQCRQEQVDSPSTSMRRTSYAPMSNTISPEMLELYHSGPYDGCSAQSVSPSTIACPSSSSSQHFPRTVSMTFEEEIEIKKE